MRNNLVNTRMVTERTGKFVTVIVPWTLSWFLYQGDAVVDVLSWTGLVLNGIVGYLMPLYAAYSFYSRADSELGIAYLVAKRGALFEQRPRACRRAVLGPVQNPLRRA